MIGFAPVKSGVNENVRVNLDTNQVTNVMYAMLHTDAGEVGKYEFPGPDVPVIVNAVMVSPEFTITSRK